MNYSSSIQREWNAIASRYQRSVEISTEQVHYGPCGPGEATLLVLGNVNGKRILDLGCGGGQNAIALARQGGLVDALDCSAEQLSFAQQRAEEARVAVSFKSGDIEDVSTWPDGPWDLVLSVFAIEYVERFDILCKSIAQKLSPDGSFVFCDLHPFVSGGDVLVPSTMAFFRTLDYFRRRAISFLWRFQEGVPGQLRRYHRPLEDYVSGLRNGGMFVEDIREPVVSNDRCGEEYPYRDQTMLSTKGLWQTLPYSIIIKAKLRSTAA